MKNILAKLGTGFASLALMCGVALAGEFDIQLGSVPMSSTGHVHVPVMVNPHYPNIGGYLQSVVLTIEYDTETLTFEGFTFATHAQGYVTVNGDLSFSPSCGGLWTTVQSTATANNLKLLLDCLDYAPGTNGCNGISLPTEDSWVTIGTIDFVHARPHIVEAYSTAVKVACHGYFSSQDLRYVTEFDVFQPSNSTHHYYGWGQSGTEISNACVKIPYGGYTSACPDGDEYFNDCLKCPPEYVPKPGLTVQQSVWSNIKEMYR
jgi:hypothetical protein